MAATLSKRGVRCVVGLDVAALPAIRLSITRTPVGHMFSASVACPGDQCKRFPYSDGFLGLTIASAGAAQRSLSSLVAYESFQKGGVDAPG
jgi:hypothetical protein